MIMKKSKLTITIIVSALTGLIIGSSISFLICKTCHEKVNFEKHHALMLKNIIKKLNMDDNQVKEFYKIHRKYFLKACDKLQVIKPALIDILEAEKKEVGSILTAEQKKKFHEIKREQIENFKLKFANAEYLDKEISDN
jgi:replication initiation and membrane attachment protein DnaB